MIEEGAKKKRRKPAPGCEGWTKKKKYVKAREKMARYKEAYRTDHCNARFRRMRGAVFAEAAAIGKEKMKKYRLAAARAAKKSRKSKK